MVVVVIVVMLVVVVIVMWYYSGGGRGDYSEIDSVGGSGTVKIHVVSLVVVVLW